MATATETMQHDLTDAEKYLQLLDQIRAYVEANPDTPTPYVLNSLGNYGDHGWEHRVQFMAHDADETRRLVRALGGGEKIDGAKGQRLIGEAYGFKWVVNRTDLACELVETDEVEEVEETEVVRPAETRTVTVQRPKLRRVCPPILGDES